MIRGYGEVVSAMLEALTHDGPMTAVELCESVGSTRDKSVRVITALLRPSARYPVPRVHIREYVFDAEGARRYPRAVYAIGALLNAVKPKPSKSDNAKRWREGRKLRVNSVWALGTKVKERLRSEQRT
jgi:hypothetical protein